MIVHTFFTQDKTMKSSLRTKNYKTFGQTYNYHSYSQLLAYVFPQNIILTILVEMA